MALVLTKYRQTFLLGICIVTVFVLYQQNIRLATEQPTITPTIKGDIPIDIQPKETQNPMQNPEEDEDQVTPYTSPDSTSLSPSYKTPVSIATIRNIVWLVEGSPVPNCEIECYFDRDGSWNSDQSIVRNADGVFYTDLSEIRTFYDPTKVNLIFASESFQHYPGQETAVQGNTFIEGMGVYFNISVNYHLETDDIVQGLWNKGRKFVHLPITYAPMKIDQFMEPPLPFSQKDQEVLMSIFVSNCHIVKSGRNEIIQKLMDLIPLHSFGSCFHNMDTSKIGCNQPHYEGKLCAIRKYKFYLAFENSIDDSYVTEKYWQALQAGTVPVYLGAPNIAEFDPLYEPNPDGSRNTNWKPRSMIRVSDFKTIEDLAKYLKEVASNETLYNSFLEWKSKPPTPRFKTMTEMSLDFSDTACRICKNVSIMRQKVLQKS